MLDQQALCLQIAVWEAKYRFLCMRRAYLVATKEVRSQESSSSVQQFTNVTLGGNDDKLDTENASAPLILPIHAMERDKSQISPIWKGPLFLSKIKCSLGRWQLMLGKAEKIEALTSIAISSAIIKGWEGRGLHSALKQASGKRWLSQIARYFARMEKCLLMMMMLRVRYSSMVGVALLEKNKTKWKHGAQNSGLWDLFLGYLLLDPQGSPAVAKCKVGEALKCN